MPARLMLPARLICWIFLLTLSHIAQANQAINFKLSEAARDGNYRQLKVLLEQGADINFTATPRTPSVLAIVVSKGNTAVARYLVDQGANAKALNPGSGCNLLQLAAGAFNTPERIDMVTLLVDAGAELNHLSERCATPLIEASIAGHQDTVAYLIQQGADLNLQYQGNSALYEALVNGHDNIASLLIENGSDLNLRSTDGSTASHVAAQFSPPLFHKMAAAGAKASVDKNGRGALGYALSGNNFALTAQLIRQPLQPSELNDALYLAVGKQQIQLISELLLLGANPLLRDRWGDSAITSARQINHPEINRLLGIQ